MSGERQAKTFNIFTWSIRARGWFSFSSFPMNWMKPQLVKASSKRQSRNDKSMSADHSTPVTLMRNRWDKSDCVWLGCRSWPSTRPIWPWFLQQDLLCELQDKGVVAGNCFPKTESCCKRQTDVPILSFSQLDFGGRHFLETFYGLFTANSENIP